MVCINSIAPSPFFPSDVWRDDGARTPRVLTCPSTALCARVCPRVAGLQIVTFWGPWVACVELLNHRGEPRRKEGAVPAPGMDRVCSMSTV